MSSGSSTEAKASRTRRRFSPFPGVRARYVLATSSPFGLEYFSFAFPRLVPPRNANVTASERYSRESAHPGIRRFFFNYLLRFLSPRYFRVALPAAITSRAHTSVRLRASRKVVEISSENQPTKNHSARLSTQISTFAWISTFQRKRLLARRSVRYRYNTGNRFYRK